MFKPQESEIVRDIKSSRSLKELEGIIHRIGDNVKQKRSKLRKLFTRLGKIFNVRLTSVSAKDTTVEIGYQQPAKVRRRGKTGPSTLIENYKHPKNVKDITNALAHIEDFYQHAYELELAEANLMKNYAGFEKGRQKALKALQDYIDEVTDSLNEAFVALNKNSEKLRKAHAPKELSLWARALYKHLNRELDKSTYSEISEPIMYASAAEDGSLNYQYFIELSGVINSTGFEFEEYWFVLTANINDKGALNYYLTTLDGFDTPGKFNPGKEVANRAAMLRRSIALLYADKVVTNLEKKPLLSTKTMKRSGRLTKIKGVKNVKVFNDTLYVFLNKSIRANQITQVLTDLIPTLKILLGTKANNSKLMHKLETTRTGQKVIKFVLTPRFASKDDQILNQQMAVLKEQLGLTDEMADNILRVVTKY